MIQRIEDDMRVNSEIGFQMPHYEIASISSKINT
jgi:hypothetical protein